jgi:hypothetical protein
MKCIVIFVHFLLVKYVFLFNSSTDITKHTHKHTCSGTYRHTRTYARTHPPTHTHTHTRTQIKKIKDENK